MQRYGVDGTPEKNRFPRGKKRSTLSKHFLDRKFNLSQDQVESTEKRGITESKGQFTEVEDIVYQVTSLFMRN